MTLREIDDDLNKKIEDNERYVRYSYFELRIARNFSESEVRTFLNLVRIKLENMNYKVYFEGDEFVFDNVERKVEANEYLVAIKE